MTPFSSNLPRPPRWETTPQRFSWPSPQTEQLIHALRPQSKLYVDPPTGLPPGFDELPDSLRSDILIAQSRVLIAEYLRIPFDQIPRELPLRDAPGFSRLRCGLDIFEAMCPYLNILAEVFSYLYPGDVLTIYCISKPVKAAIDHHLTSLIRFWLSRISPDAPAAFPWRMYKRLTVPDPAGRTFNFSNPPASFAVPPTPSIPLTPLQAKLNQTIRPVPSLRYFLMASYRSQKVHQIIALFARKGHRLGSYMHTALMKLWHYNILQTNALRQMHLSNRNYMTDKDLYFIQMFLIKFKTLMTDPIYGPFTDATINHLMGLPGLQTVYDVLFRRRYTSFSETMYSRIHYDGHASEATRALIPWGTHFWGHNLSDVGIRSHEYFGRDPSVTTPLVNIVATLPWEATKRGLDFGEHLEAMLVWGTFDWQTGRNLLPTEEEISMHCSPAEEEDLLSRLGDTKAHLRRRHCLKTKLRRLPYHQQEAIRLEERCEEARAVFWHRISRCMDSKFKGPHLTLKHTNVENYNIEWEMRRGWMIPEMSREELAFAAAMLPRYEHQPRTAELLDLQTAAEHLAKDVSASDVVDYNLLALNLMDGIDERDLDFDMSAWNPQDILPGNGEEGPQTNVGGAMEAPGLAIPNQWLAEEQIEAHLSWESDDEVDVGDEPVFLPTGVLF